MLFWLAKPHNNHIKYTNFARPTLLPRAAYVGRYIVLTAPVNWCY